MKKFGLFLSMMVILTGVVFANGNNEAVTESKIQVGMVTDSGSIDDKSFNQGTWGWSLKSRW